MWLLRALLGLISLAACGPGDVFEDSSDKATREAQDTLYQQTLTFVGTHAATIAALQATADSAAAMGTQIVRLNAQNQALQATLDALARGGQLPGNVQPQPPAAQPGGQTSGSNDLFPSSAATPTPPTGGTVYLEATTATRVSDKDGCAEDSVTTFTPSSERIYMVVEAQNVKAGITYYTRWLYGGENRFETVTWVSDADYEELCIWFYVTPADMFFTPGSWQVQLIADQLATISRSFTVEGGELPTAEGENMDAEATETVGQ
jgi:hypothetical protein